MPKPNLAYLEGKERKGIMTGLVRIELGRMSVQKVYTCTNLQLYKKCTGRPAAS
jgi:hypothetical protein